MWPKKPVAPYKHTHRRLGGVVLSLLPVWCRWLCTLQRVWLYSRHVVSSRSAGLDGGRRAGAEVEQAGNLFGWQKPLENSSTWGSERGAKKNWAVSCQNQTDSWRKAEGPENNKSFTQFPTSLSAFFFFYTDTFSHPRKAHDVYDIERAAFIVFFLTGVDSNILLSYLISKSP